MQTHHSKKNTLKKKKKQNETYGKKLIEKIGGKKKPMTKQIKKQKN